jgi:predicted transposase YbfD/YdcC
VRVVARRRVAGSTSQETRYFLSSLTTGARSHQEAIRGHWGIENQVHRVLDVVFREDLSRVRRGHAAHNFSLLRRLALNLLRQDHTARCGIKGHRLKAALSPAYLLSVLGGAF